MIKKNLIKKTSLEVFEFEFDLLFDFYATPKIWFMRLKELKPRFLPSKSVLCPRICSLINLFDLGAFSACLIPTEVWSKCPGPLLGTCEQQYTCN